MHEDMTKALLKKALASEDVGEFVDVTKEQESELEIMEEIPLESLDKTIMDAEGLLVTDTGASLNIVKVALYYVQGYKSADIGRLMGVSPDYIRTIWKTPKFKELVSIFTKEIIVTARTFLGASGLKAVTTLISCMNSIDDRIRLQAATQVLDRIGLKTPEQIEVISNDKLDNMSEDELMAFIKKGMKDIIPKDKGSEGGEEDKQ